MSWETIKGFTDTNLKNISVYKHFIGRKKSQIFSLAVEVHILSQLYTSENHYERLNSARKYLP